MPPPVFPSDDIDEMQRLVSEYLKLVRRRRGWSQAETARIAGVSKQTIGRNENPSPDYRFVMSAKNLQKIARSSGLSPPRELLSPAPNVMASGFAEPDVTPWEGESPKELKPAHPDQSIWVVESRSLEQFGYMPGDLILLDRRVPARPGRAVCAQVIGADGAETVFRVYDPPFLISLPIDPSVRAKPLMVDGERVDIVGTVIRSLRVVETD